MARQFDTMEGDSSGSSSEGRRVTAEQELVPLKEVKLPEVKIRKKMLIVKTGSGANGVKLPGLKVGPKDQPKGQCSCSCGLPNPKYCMLDLLNIMNRASTRQSQIRSLGWFPMAISICTT